MTESLRTVKTAHVINGGARPGPAGTRALAAKGCALADENSGAATEFTTKVSMTGMIL